MSRSDNFNLDRHRYNRLVLPGKPAEITTADLYILGHRFGAYYANGEHNPSKKKNEANNNMIASLLTALPEWQPSIRNMWNNFVTGSCRKDSPNASIAPSVGFSFSPAGLLLPYHLGVIECLKHWGILTIQTPLAGASAGALAIVVAACDVSADSAMGAISRVEENIRHHGTARRLHSVLSKELDMLLPSDAIHIINSRPGKITIAYTNVWPIVRGQFVSIFETYEDLKECLAASCNIPFYFYKWPTITCRGKMRKYEFSACVFTGYQSVDGFFASRRTFGCPKTSASRDVHVLPFASKSVYTSFPKGNVISPELQEYDVWLNSVSNKLFERELLDYLQSYPLVNEYLSSWKSLKNSRVVTASAQTTVSEKDLSFCLSPLMNEEREYSSCYVDSIDVNVKLQTLQTDCQSSVELLALSSRELPVLKYSTSQLLKIALDATSNATIKELFDLGRADAFRWIYLERWGYGL